MRFVINRLFKRPAKKTQRGRPAPRDRRPRLATRLVHTAAEREPGWAALARV